MKPSVTLLTTCKGRLSYLKRVLPSWRKQNYYGKLEILVIDYGCPDKTRDWCKEEGIRCVFASTEDSFFNMSHARNVGVCSSSSDIICCVDSHNVLSPIYVSTAVRAIQAGYDLIHPDEIIGSASYPRELFHQLRGYDEVLDIYGCEDCDFNDRARVLGHQVGTIPRTLIDIIYHTDEEKTRYYPNKDLWASIAINSQKVVDKYRPINSSGYGKL